MILSITSLRRRSRRLGRQLWALLLALRDPATPKLARIAIVCAFAYAASPIDLIPDFIPVLGQLDDLIIVPALLGLALRLIPKDVASRCRREAYRLSASGKRPRGPAPVVAAIVFILAWLALAIWLVRLVLGRTTKLQP